ncbi:MAG TPA: hydrogenase expression/formation protein HypE [Acidobacteria bacterium]|nr:hydrogenase expression/formation protein HypE [Acidobacteriota bacterium]
MSGPPERILLAHGAGGRLTQELIRERFLPALANPYLAELTDGAVLPELPPGRPALTTDGFVVSPPVFPGGDLGKLAVCGTVNDLAMVGARPLWLTLALILEEGAAGDLVDRCIASVATAAREAEVAVVAGDTKVVPRGSGDVVYAVTTGLGVVPPGRELGDALIQAGDAIVASGPLGDHGAAIMAVRHGIDPGELTSDCAPLAGLVEALLASGARVRSLHDPTRGGLVAACHETAQRCGLRMLLEEEHVSVRPQVQAVCELLGLDPLGLACEGRFLAWVDVKDVDAAVAALRAHPLGSGAARIGTVEERPAGSVAVALRTATGSVRPLDLLSGMDLPRIC